MFEKIWQRHEVLAQTPARPATIRIDLQLVHEAAYPQPLDALRKQGTSIRHPNPTIVMLNDVAPTRTEYSFCNIPIAVETATSEVRELEEYCRRTGIELFKDENQHRGSIHVFGPETGITQPGMTLVCDDSHASTHGAFGALAFGIDHTEVGQVLATHCLRQFRPDTFAINVNGKLNPGVTAKDLVLGITSQVGIFAGTDHVIEYRGETIRALDMEGRMTVCNMSVETGARASLIAPDETTYTYLAGRPRSPVGDSWYEALAEWRQLTTDPGAHFDRQLSFAAQSFEPMIAYGAHPAMAIPISGVLPRISFDPAFARTLACLGLEPGQSLRDQPIQTVYIGSCANGRLSDLLDAATVLHGQKLAKGIRLIIAPGSRRVKVAAEAAGLDRIFRDAGAEWCEPGCSPCINTDHDPIPAGHYLLSTGNRNCGGRRGGGPRTLLASPLTAAASAVRGKVTDPREFVS